MTTRLLTASKSPPTATSLTPRLALIHATVLAGALALLAGLVVLVG